MKRLLGCILIKYNSYPYIKRKFEYRQRDDVKTKGEDGHLKPRIKAKNRSFPVEKPTIEGQFTFLDPRIPLEPTMCSKQTG